MTTMDMQPTAQNLEAAGADPRLAAVLAENFARASAQRERGPSSINILAAATTLGFALVIASMGWLLSEVHANRDLIETNRGLIEANRDRIDANRDRIDAAQTRLSGEIQNMSERLTRIETLLEERLPARR